jgi:hypothetical protein
MRELAAQLHVSAKGLNWLSVPSTRYFVGGCWSVSSAAMAPLRFCSTSAYVIIRQHTSASMRPRTSAYVSIRSQHTSAYAAYVSWGGAGRGYGAAPRLPHASAYISIRQHGSTYVSIRQHTSAYVSIRQHTSAYAGRGRLWRRFCHMRQQEEPHTANQMSAIDRAS